MHAAFAAPAAQLQQLRSSCRCCTAAPSAAGDINTSTSARGTSATTGTSASSISITVTINSITVTINSIIDTDNSINIIDNNNNVMIIDNNNSTNNNVTNIGNTNIDTNSNGTNVTISNTTNSTTDSGTITGDTNTTSGSWAHSAQWAWPEGPGTTRCYAPGGSVTTTCINTRVGSIITTNSGINTMTSGNTTNSVITIFSEK